MQKVRNLREMRNIERMNRAHPDLFVVAGPVVERRKCEVVEN